MTNGQVYFGHLSQIDSSYVKLDNTYYLQAQPKDSTQATIQLTKLGRIELHGPEDVMYVSRQQVLFWENLRDDSKVVTTIKADQKK